jgi:hypothetical protein
MRRGVPRCRRYPASVPGPRIFEAGGGEEDAAVGETLEMVGFEMAIPLAIRLLANLRAALDHVLKKALLLR